MSLPQIMDVEMLRALMIAEEHTVASAFSAFNRQHATTNQFKFIDYFMREQLRQLIIREHSRSPRSPQIAVHLLSTIRLIARDPDNLEVLFSDPLVGEYIKQWAELPAPEGTELGASDINVRQEATKCLVNTLYNCPLMRTYFDNTAHAALSDYILFYVNADPSPPSTVLLFYLLRLVFITTAHGEDRRTFWLQPEHYARLAAILKEGAEERRRMERGQLGEPELDERTREVLKIFFNLYCKNEVVEYNEECMYHVFTDLSTLLRFGELPDQEAMHQCCVNLLSTLPVKMELIVSEIDKENHEFPMSCVFENLDMTMISQVLKLAEMRIDQNDMDQVGTALAVLIKYTTAKAEVRRYVRLQVLPPLREVDVSRRPEEGDEMRNKLVRLMMGVTRNATLASELMFILCKRSVGRLIKYTGLGHSAGILANSGLLGQINGPRSDENSEDSETEEYAEVEPRVNPVTGCIRPADSGVSPFEGMSEEQKEYEAMKLVDAMNRLMESGVIKPGTVGEDGVPRAVSHVLELTKNIPDQDEDEDSD